VRQVTTDVHMRERQQTDARVFNLVSDDIDEQTFYLLSQSLWSGAGC